MNHKTKWIAAILVLLVISWPVHTYWKNQVDKAQIAELLKIDHLPKGTQIVSIRKDLLPDTVIVAVIKLPAGTVTDLLAGLPFKVVDTSGLGSTMAGVRITRSWTCLFSNANFNIDCDESCEVVTITCAVN